MPPKYHRSNIEIYQLIFKCCPDDVAWVAGGIKQVDFLPTDESGGFQVLRSWGSWFVEGCQMSVVKHVV